MKIWPDHVSDEEAGVLDMRRERAAHITIVDRGPTPPRGSGTRLRPGERIINGRIRYSSAWLSNPKEAT